MNKVGHVRVDMHDSHTPLVRISGGFRVSGLGFRVYLDPLCT